MKARLYRIFTEIARQHISLMLAITLFDLILIRMRETFTVCLSFLLPQRILIWGNKYIEVAQAKVDSFEGLHLCIYALIAICFALFIICLVCSYRRAAWLLCAAAITLSDTALVAYMLIQSRDATYYLDIAAHVWMIAALVAGYLFERVRQTESGRPQEMFEENQAVQEAEAEQIQETAPEGTPLPEESEPAEIVEE